MKKAFGILFILCLTLSMAGCSQDDPVVSSLGKPSSREMYTHGGFQDYTDYGKFLFDSVTEEDLENSSRFSPVAGQGEDVLAYIDNFENWVTIISADAPDSPLVTNYDFDRTTVDQSDYFFVDTLEGQPIGGSTYGKFDNYTLYFFDTESGILYYFHSNI